MYICKLKFCVLGNKKISPQVTKFLRTDVQLQSALNNKRIFYTNHCCLFCNIRGWVVCKIGLAWSARKIFTLYRTECNSPASNENYLYAFYLLFFEWCFLAIFCQMTCILFFFFWCCLIGKGFFFFFFFFLVLTSF